MSMGHRRIAFVSCVAAILNGCWRDFDYEYISLSGKMEIIEYGRSSAPDLRHHTDMPVRWKLTRDQYDLFAEVDRTAIAPSMLFSIEGKSLIDATIKGTTPSPCIGGFIDIIPSEVERRGYPEGGLRYLWQPSSSTRCRDAVAANGSENRLVIEIYNGVGTLIAEEEILFVVKTNGIHREYDGP